MAEATYPREASASAPPRAARAPMLRIGGLSAFYGELRAIYDVNLTLGDGEILSIIGANGAGKSTLMKSVMGMMNRGSAAHVRGEVVFRGTRLDRLGTESIVDAGVAMVPEGRRLFPRMTVEDNLLCGAWLPRCRATMRERLDEVYELFPKLAERRTQLVSLMSGGEQQMVAIGRALMSSPSLLLVDELSLGLAPVVVDDIYRTIRDIHRRGVSCVVIEQDLSRALAVADQVCVMLEGSIVLEGTPSSLTRAQIEAAYFGTAT